MDKLFGYLTLKQIVNGKASVLDRNKIYVTEEELIQQ